MKEITHHKQSELNEALKIIAIDEPGQGGAHHVYTIYLDESKRRNPLDKTVHFNLNFQNGPIQEYGVNGITQEVLLAVVIDRLECFQAGKFACEENRLALEAAKTALNHLKSRTTKRVARNIEGKSVV